MNPHTVNVPEFASMRTQGENLQYLEFVAGGCYEARAFWGERR